MNDEEERYGQRTGAGTSLIPWTRSRRMFSLIDGSKLDQVGYSANIVEQPRYDGSSLLTVFAFISYCYKCKYLRRKV